MSKAHEMQKLIRLYREETGQTEIDMHDVALFAMRKGWPMPQPKSPLDLLAAQFRDAARQEVRRDRASGRPYRAYHAVPSSASQGVFFWIDIDDPETTQSNMRKSAIMRREQMVDDGVQLSLDLDHWNGTHPDEERIELPMDITPDIEWRKAAMDDDREEGEAA
jgi:hypothetical protein